MKKDKSRFTIRFNEADPRQVKVMEALEVAGRRKASLITDAVCDYLARYGDGNVTVIPPPITPNMIANTNQSEASYEAKGEPPPQPQKSSVDATMLDLADESLIDSDMCVAVMEGLSFFN